MFKLSTLSKLARLFAVCGLAWAATITPASAKSSDVDQLRAAIVFNVLRFIEFVPEQRGTIDFCVAPDADGYEAFRSFSGRRAGSRIVSVRTARDGSYSGCDVVYLDSGGRDQIQRASARGRLVIGGGRRFIDNGGTVGLVQSGGQVRFQLNLVAASNSQLTISSRLIRLASKVAR